MPLPKTSPEQGAPAYRIASVMIRVFGFIAVTVFMIDGLVGITKGRYWPLEICVLRDALKKEESAK